MNDAKSEIQNIKDLRKKYCLSMEDFEKFQMKIINMKKSQVILKTIKNFVIFFIDP